MGVLAVNGFSVGSSLYPTLIVVVIVVSSDVLLNRSNSA